MQIWEGHNLVHSSDQRWSEACVFAHVSLGICKRVFAVCVCVDFECTSRHTCLCTYARLPFCEYFVFCVHVHMHIVYMFSYVQEYVHIYVFCAFMYLRMHTHVYWHVSVKICAHGCV